MHVFSKGFDRDGRIDIGIYTNKTDRCQLRFLKILVKVNLVKIKSPFPSH